MKDVLKEIITTKIQRLIQSKQSLPQEELIERIKAAGYSPQPFIKSIDRTGSISLIAEIKKASPSSGIIRQNFNLQEIATCYKEAGVQAISVLTEEDYFLAGLDYISQVKQVVDLPILRKDFIFEPYQIYESRAFGCDAILLIAEILSLSVLREFLSLAQTLNLTCLVEVHTEKDLKKVLKCKEAVLIGINNRNLHTLEVDFETTQKLFPLIPKERLVVVESGIRTYQDVLFLKVLGVKAVLIGEAFMAASDIKLEIQKIMGW